MIYSHTSLSLWNLCKRRWWHRYMRGVKEPQTPVMLFSIYLLHETMMQPEPDWDAQWAKFTTEVGDASFKNTLLSLDTAKRIHRSFVAFKDEFEEIIAVERMELITLDPSLHQFQSKPDFVAKKEGICSTVDFKFVTSNWPSAKRPWPLRPLAAFDNQLLGQAITVGATGTEETVEKFVRVSFQGDRKSGNISGPVIEEKCVDLALSSEWKAETIATIDEIEMWKAKDPGVPWPKNDQACNAFGKPCPHLAACGAGWKRDLRSVQL